ncbi:lipopolysaccharide biosynthesis protein [Sediminicola luteus]|uniref:Sugar isomerase n=1 Tax=Sediminicola luteus TaxID=319238 RepID=A0A2A4G5Z2_9FLAO|nr:polysaccharide biosynthesis C-terminal domain-containing protein [Sediminicola luteus]PCE63853.1 sugar isomerase [Sediminicola luteus]
MGIVLKQSLNNTIITFIGFGIGGINTLFLYTNFLSEEYYGLVGVILATATLLMPIMAFGVPNTMVKYFSGYAHEKEKDGFLTVMLFLPLVAIIPIGIFAWVADSLIISFLSKRNALVGGYFWHIFIIGVAMAYFELFYTWGKVQLKSVFGNFMKEVFVRIGVSLLLLLVYFDAITVTVFLQALVGLYVLRLLIMKWYAFRLRWPKISFKFPANTKTVIWYSLFIIFGASAAMALTEIDKFMMNLYIPLDYIAYYTVAVFMARVVAVPSRAMHQITYPLSAKLLNEGKIGELGEIYKKSSLTLFALASLLLILVLVSVRDLYQLLPEGYEQAFLVVLLLGLTKVYDSFLGNNNAILFSSDYYKTVLYLGVLLAVVTVLLNMWLLPIFGMMGAAWATVIAIVLYNTIKLVFVWRKLGIHPLQGNAVGVGVLALALGLLFYYLPLPFDAIPNIVIRSVLVASIFMGVMLKFNLSKDISDALVGLLKGKTP